MAMLSAAIAKHTLAVRLAEAGQQLMQVPMISMIRLRKPNVLDACRP
jgi:hypothetical protein